MWQSFLHFLASVNRSRLARRKQRRIDRETAGAVSVCTHRLPDSIRRVLLIDPLECFGDALFVNGLVRVLQQRGLEICLLTHPKLFGLYATLLCEDRLFNLWDPNAVREVCARAWDAAVDLSYASNTAWTQRKVVVEHLASYTFTCDRSVGCGAGRTLYSDYLDVSVGRHFGDRMALVAQRLTGEITESVRPCADVRPAALERPYVYVNTAGRFSPRCLTQAQTDRICRELERHNMLGLIFCAPGIEVAENEYVRAVRPATFVDCLQLIAGAQGVISPDTSVVHAASAYDKPLLAFYCANDPEVYGLQMRDVWAPMTRQSTVLVPPPQGTHRTPIGAIAPEALDEGLEAFFRALSV